ncbi:ADP-binding protein [Tritonibacter multivorans]|uniref:tRNA threonylcarbamoyladenosine biosynthesis protein TsaE n=2 Tax=Tritonibacter multivorans TaxID=928856 RepID=A0A0P1GDL8_9RHOB|nr:tRNA (adenosine(37)-N6)-threonylcarbamoyltransferase complex ATPase subunit type 1 TsaE [Tritonibacter multivorans]MDA7420112.1 tRNA (adenosine(37)-N6)-threonylcarbamoyltransferase complex ATPase subunit type 1 TsaE [Tritonibacter multivorans]CUH79710.1 ADP-binding protein [Tritonibacter multivorans]SFC04117.1 tRNA threonylcarbamoyladenosine biosynthesis protein TsaE [Tritonibacter multivorans]
MMTPQTTYEKQLTFTTPDHTSRIASDIAQRLVPGDVILLEGPIGTGKTHFCRSLIQALMTVPEDVPSPTFTLVQVYDVPAGELWHADLYRLGHADEVEELGLLAAFEDAICLVEWPDRLEELAPAHALTVTLSLVADAEESRTAELRWSDPKWAEKLDTL